MTDRVIDEVRAMTTIERPRTRRRSVRRLVTFAVLAVLLLYLLNMVGPTTTESRTFDLGSGTTVLHVEVGTGSVVLTPAVGESIRVHGTVRHGWLDPDTEVRTDGSRAVIEAACPAFSPGRCEVHYEIAVPDGHAVELSVSTGTVDVRGVRTESLRTRVSSGRTTLVDVVGPVEMVSSSGEVSATGLRSSRVSADVSSGDVELDFSEPPTDVTVSASSGDVTLQLPATGNPYRVRADSNSGQARVDVPTDPGSARSVSVRVSSGDVVVASR